MAANKKASRASTRFSKASSKVSLKRGSKRYSKAFRKRSSKKLLKKLCSEAEEDELYDDCFEEYESLVKQEEEEEPVQQKRLSKVSKRGKRAKSRSGIKRLFSTDGQTILWGDDSRIRRSDFSAIEEEEEDEEEEEEEDEEEEEEDELEEVSSFISFVSGVSFTWEEEVYRFGSLSDPGYFETAVKRSISRTDYFDEVGTEQYILVCNSLNILPMTRVLMSLKTDEIDLSFRNLDGNHIRALCAPLEVNGYVTRLLLRYNRLNPKDCSYIGYVLLYNEKLSHLDLTGCGIGPQGLELLTAFLGRNLFIEVLILSKCNIQDEGMKLLAPILARNTAIKKLDLSYNNLADESGESLSMAFKWNITITDLILRYNNLFDPAAMKTFYTTLTNSPSLTLLDLSWNGLSGVEMAGLIAKFLRKSQTIQYLDLSDNRLEGLAALEIKKALPKVKCLEVLKMGKNPLSPEDLESLLNGVKACPTLVVFDLEDLWVKKPFLKTLNKLKQERDIEVNFGGVFSNYEIVGPDYPAIILKRAQYEAQKPKKERLKRDFGHLMFSLGHEPITQSAFMELVKKFKAKINKQLYPELLKQFTIPKSQLIDVVAMRKKYLSLFPDSKPPRPKKLKKVKGKGKRKYIEVEDEEEGEGEEFEEFDKELAKELQKEVEEEEEEEEEEFGEEDEEEEEYEGELEDYEEFGEYSESEEYSHDDEEEEIPVKEEKVISEDLAFSSYLMNDSALY